MLMGIEQAPKKLLPIAPAVAAASLTWKVGDVVGFVEKEQVLREFSAEDASNSYSDFLIWRGLLAEPNREQRSADVLQRFRIFPYLPHYVDQEKASRPGTRRMRVSAVIPGKLFVPDEYLNVPNRDAAFECAGVRIMKGSGGLPLKLLKSDIELIRTMEAKLNLPPERKGVLFEIGQEVRFTDDLFASSWGTAIIKEIASESRIGVEVAKLFGCSPMVYVPASEIEAV